MVATRFPKSWATPDFDTKDASLILYLPLWYPYSDMTGSTIYSYDKNRFSTTVTGAVWDRYGRVFDGNDLLAITSVATLNPSSITISAWVYPTTESAAAQYAVVAKGDATNKTGYYMSWKNGGADYKFNFNWGDGVTWFTKETTDSYTALNTWYHLSATFDQTTWSIYVNGILNNSGVEAGTIQSNTVVLNVGRDPTGGGNWYWKGTIGDMLIYNRALTAGEIRNIYQVTKWRYV